MLGSASAVHAQGTDSADSLGLSVQQGPLSMESLTSSRWASLLPSPPPAAGGARFASPPHALAPGLATKCALHTLCLQAARCGPLTSSVPGPWACQLSEAWPALPDSPSAAAVLRVQAGMIQRTQRAEAC